MKRIEYHVEIVGHEAPFKWTLKRRLNGVTSSLEGGEVDSREEALWAAADKAHDYEYKRLHSSTVEIVPLFTADIEGAIHAPETDAS